MTVLPDDLHLLTWVSRPQAARTLFLLVPGLSGNARQWAYLEAELAGRGYAVAHVPPVLAHPGLSAARPLIEDVAAAAEHELRHSGYSHIVVLAHSVGSFVGFSLAARLPDHVAGVLAVNGGLYSVGRFLDAPIRGLWSGPTMALAALRMVSITATPTPTWLREFVLRRPRVFRLVAGRLVPRELAGDEQTRRILAHSAVPAGILPGLWANRHHWSRFTRNAAAATPPVVLVTGTLDPLSSERDSHRMAAMFPAATVHLLPGVGHAATIEAADTLLELALRFAEPEPACAR